jgi:hypothetical protein
LFFFKVINCCECFGRGSTNFDSRIGNKVSNPWCHGYSWDCVSLVLATIRL